MWFARRCECAVLGVLVFASCTSTIEVSLVVRGGETPMGREQCPSRNRNQMLPEQFINHYLVQSYRPQNGTCCGTGTSCGPLEVIEEACVTGPVINVTPASLNTQLQASGLVLDDWDPERPTCIRVIAFQDETTVDATSFRSVSCADWEMLIPSARVCGQTSAPARGTGLVQVDDTACTTADTSTIVGLVQSCATR